MLPAVPVLLLDGGGGQREMIVTAIVLGVAWCLIVAVVMSALNNVLRVALYRYAVACEAPSGFEDVDFAGIFPRSAAACWARRATAASRRTGSNPGGGSRVSREGSRRRPAEAAAARRAALPRDREDHREQARSDEHDRRP